MKKQVAELPCGCVVDHGEGHLYVLQRCARIGQLTQEVTEDPRPDFPRAEVGSFVVGRHYGMIHPH